MNDERLEALARGLGRRAGAALDVERTSGAVVARLRAARASRWHAAAGWLKAAAVATLLVGGAWFAYRAVMPDGPAAPVALAAPLPLQALTVDELEEVLDSLTAEAPTHALVASGLGTLDEGQLEELLQLMEG
jgi:hypothetical protein